jgi:hypothetical protein
LFLFVRVFSSRMNICSIVIICACVFLLFVPLFNCFYLCVFIEQRYIQEDNRRTD